ncbi:hypothetical protein BC828DRAFT_376602 [Blastocladiella britannica]|nr:hypothetical protein BC828DRAFT_376602 [Blastocladiella britannica]
MSSINWLTTFGLIALLTVDHCLPYFGVARILSNSWCSSCLTIIASQLLNILTDLYARNALGIVLSGTDQNGLVTMMSFAAINESITGIGTRTAIEIRHRGLKAVEWIRIKLVVLALLGWAVSTAWGSFASNYLGTRNWVIYSSSSMTVPAVDPTNPYGFNKCADSILSNKISFLFGDGPYLGLDKLLTEVYSAPVVDAEIAIRNTTSTYADDFLHTTYNGMRYTVMLPKTPDNFTVYNTTALGVNVTCSVKGAPKMGQDQTTSNTSPSATFTLPTGFMQIVDAQVAIPKGYPLLSPLTGTTISDAVNSATVMTYPSCSAGVCRSFSYDTVFALKCGINAVTMDVKVTKLFATAGVYGLTDSVVATDLALGQNVHLDVRSVTNAAAVPAALHLMLDGWTSALQWSWLNRAYRYIYDGATYVAAATESRVARDYEIMLAYAALGLAMGTNHYQVTATGVNGGCDGVIATGATGTLSASTPSLGGKKDTVITRVVLDQATYSWPIAMYAVAVALMVLLLLPPVATFPWTRKASATAVSPEVGGEEAAPTQQVSLRMAVASGCHGFDTAVLRMVGANGSGGEDATAAAAKPAKYRLQPTVGKGDVDFQFSRYKSSKNLASAVQEPLKSADL